MTGDFLNRLFILVVDMIVLGLFTECSILNERPVKETTVCAPEKLIAKCRNDEKIIIEAYQAGVSVRSECRQNNDGLQRNCCNRNNRDCLNPINDTESYHACTAQSSCLLWLKQSSVACQHNFYSINYHTLQYYCIEDYRFGRCTSAVMKSCEKGQILYLSSPGYPINVTESVTCGCLIESDCVGESIDVFEIDVKISWKDTLKFEDSSYKFIDDRDNNFILSYRKVYSSFSNKILMNASLANGRFLIAIRTKEDCLLSIKCPHFSSINASNCDKHVSTSSTRTMTEISSTYSSANSTTKTKDINSKVSSNINSTVSSNINSTVSSNINSTVSSNINSTVSSNINSTVSSNINSTVSSNINSTGSSNINSTVSSKDEFCFGWPIILLISFNVIQLLIIIGGCVKHFKKRSVHPYRKKTDSNVPDSDEGINISMQWVKQLYK